jgi:hypothetical protein
MMPDPRDELRERLLAMRETLVDGLAASPVIESGYLALLGHVGAALAALDAAPPKEGGLAGAAMRGAHAS